MPPAHTLFNFRTHDVYSCWLCHFYAKLQCIGLDNFICDQLKCLFYCETAQMASLWKLKITTITTNKWSRKFEIYASIYDVFQLNFTTSIGICDPKWVSLTRQFIHRSILMSIFDFASWDIYFIYKFDFSPHVFGSFGTIYGMPTQMYAYICTLPHRYTRRDIPHTINNSFMCICTNLAILIAYIWELFWVIFLFLKWIQI